VSQKTVKIVLVITLSNFH